MFMLFSTESELPRVHAAPTPNTKVVLPNAIPLVVTVYVELPERYQLPLFVLVIPVAAKLTLPWKAIPTVPANVTLPVNGPAIVKDAHRAIVTPASIVAVYAVALDKESKLTASKDVGIAAPEPPPDDVDHLVVLDQLPVPPTQYSVRGDGVAVKMIAPVLPAVFVLFAPT